MESVPVLVGQLAGQLVLVLGIELEQRWVLLLAVE